MTIYTDDFNRSNASGPTSLGSPWVTQGSSGAGFPAIVSNQLRLATQGSGRSMCRYDTGANTLNHFSELKFKGQNHDHPTFAWYVVGSVIVRIQGDLTSSQAYTMSILCYDHAAGDVFRYVLQDGNATTGTSLQDASLSGGASSGDLFRLTAIDSGTGVDLVMTKNGTQFGSTQSIAYADSNYYGAGGFGIGLPATPRAGEDTGSTDWDDWSGGDNPDISVTLTGAVATSAAGSVTIGLEIQVTPTGVAATASTGSPTETGTSTLTLTGIAATASPGSLVAIPGISADLDGVGITASIGTETVTANANVSVSGVDAISHAGDVSITSNSPNILLDGVLMNASAGAVLIPQSIAPELAGIEMILSPGVLFNQRIPDQLCCEGPYRTLSIFEILIPVDHCFDFIDDFDRPDGPLGANWTYYSESSGNQASIVGDEYSASALHMSLVANAPPGNVSGWSEVTWVGYTSVAWLGPLVLGSGIPGAFKRYFLVCSDNGGSEPRGRIQLCRNDTSIVLEDISGIQLSGYLFSKPIRLRFLVEPAQTTLWVYVDGDLIVTHVDSSALRRTDGKPGLHLAVTTASTSNAWDDYSCHTCPAEE